MISGDLFGPTTGVLTAGQECARAVLIFLYGLILVRLAGRRVFGKWSSLDIVVSIVVGSTLSRALTGSAPLWGTLAATTLLMGLHWLLAHAAAASRSLSRLLEGLSISLAVHGQVQTRTLIVNGVSAADLCEALHGSGIDDPSDTRLIMLEPSGKISVLKRPRP